MNILGTIAVSLAFKHYLDVKEKYDDAINKAKREEALLLPFVNNYYQAKDKILSTINKENSDLDSYYAKNESPYIKVIPVLHIVSSDDHNYVRVRIELIFQSLSQTVTSYIVDSYNVGRGLAYSMTVDGKEVFFGDNCPFGFTLNPSEQRTLIVPPAGEYDISGGLYPKLDELKAPRYMTATVIFYYYDSENTNIRRATYSYVTGLIKNDISGKQTSTWKLV